MELRGDAAIVARAARLCRCALLPRTGTFADKAPAAIADRIGAPVWPAGLCHTYRGIQPESRQRPITLQMGQESFLSTAASKIIGAKNTQAVARWIEHQ